MNTLLLDQTAWDLVLDASGNIAMASPPYALAQDVASAVRTFLGEVYYNTTLGVQYFADAPAALLAQAISNQALTVPGVVSAQTIVSFKNGVLSGQVIFTGDSGETTEVSFG